MVGDIINKYIKFISSLKFAIFLLLFIALYSIIGTILPQGLNPEMYSSRYGSLGNVILFFQLNKAYTSVFFLVLVSLFIINLTLCTIKILPGQIKRMKSEFYLKPRNDTEDLYISELNLNKLREKLAANRYKLKQTDNGYIASKHKIGAIGSSVTHLGIIILLLGAFVGAVLGDEGFFNLLPGETKAFQEYGFQVSLDDFYLKYRENGSVEQYYSDLTIEKTNENPIKNTIWVNKPIKVNSINLYQTSYGWASDLLISNSNEEIIEKKVLRNGESFFYKPEHLTVYLYGFYPDFTLTKSGEPFSMTENIKNPHYAVIIYHFNDHLGSYIIEPGQPIKQGDLVFTFENSRMYTGITYRRDLGYGLVVLGCITLLIGLVLSFYFYPKFIIVEDNSIRTATRQNNWGFNYRIKQLINQISRKED